MAVEEFWMVHLLHRDRQNAEIGSSGGAARRGFVLRSGLQYDAETLAFRSAAMTRVITRSTATR